MIKFNKKYIYNSTIKSLFNKIYRNYPDNVFLTNSSILNKEKRKEYTYKDVKKDLQ